MLHIKKRNALDLFLTQLRPIMPYIKDPDVQEVMINNGENIFIQVKGVMERANAAIDEVAIRGAIKALASANTKDVFPVMDARMPGYRIAAALSPVSIHGNAVCIRKHTNSKRSLSSYYEEGSFDPQRSAAHSTKCKMPMPDLAEVRKGNQALYDFLRWCVISKQNMVIVGATGSGKTTFINSLIGEIPPEDRVLTIEDTAELIVTVPNYVGFETLEIPDGENIDIRKLVRLSLRFRPDRIIVGEVRGGEAYDLMDVLNTGHGGGFCSFHADSAKLALYRLESLVRTNPVTNNLPLLSLREQICKTFQVVIFCSQDGNMRRPTEIVMVRGLVNGDYDLQSVFFVS